jgi:hypothetical protein
VIKSVDADEARGSLRVAPSAIAVVAPASQVFGQRVPWRFYLTGPYIEEVCEGKKTKDLLRGPAALRKSFDVARYLIDLEIHASAGCEPA